MPGQSKIIQFPAPDPGKSQDQARERYTRRKDGLYQLELRYKDAAGVSRKKSFYGRTQGEALQKRKAFERDLAAGLSPEASKITLGQYAAAWLKKQKIRYKNKPTSREYAMYEREINRLYDTINRETPLRSIAKTDLQLVLDGMSGRGGGVPSESAVKEARLVLRRFFEDAVDDGLLLRDPARKLSLPDADAGTHEELPPAMRRLIADTWQGDRFGPLAMLMLFAGLRRGEAAALQYSDVDLPRRLLHVRSAFAYDSNAPIAKGPKSLSGVRDIPIPPQLLPVFDPEGQGYVVRSAHGKPLTESALDAGWDSYLYYLGKCLCGVNRRWVDHYNRKAAVADPGRYNASHPKYVWRDVMIRMHDLRHTYATMLYDSGVDVKRAQTLLGHADIETTMKIYVHLSELRRQRSDDAMDAYFSSNMCFAAAAPQAAAPAAGAPAIAPPATPAPGAPAAAVPASGSPAAATTTPGAPAPAVPAPGSPAATAPAASAPSASVSAPDAVADPQAPAL